MNPSDEPTFCLLKMACGETIVAILLKDEKDRLVVQYPRRVNETFETDETGLHHGVFFSDWLVDVEHSVTWIKKAQIVSGGIPSVVLRHSYLVSLKTEVGPDAVIGFDDHHTEPAMPKTLADRIKNFNN